MSARNTAFQRALEPASATFSPVPYKLAQIVMTRGEEYSSNDTPKPYNNQIFDPWRRGDLVVVERRTRSYPANWKDKPTESVSWYVGRRHTTPAAKRQLIALRNDGAAYEPGSNCTLWRIVLRYHAAAAKLIGVEFATREALEAALDNPESITIAEAA